MQKQNGKPTRFQAVILWQISRHLDDDGYCRILNAELARICSDVTKSRIAKEITALTRAGFLEREIDRKVGVDFTERRLQLTAKNREVS